MSEVKCEICGTPLKVVGHTTISLSKLKKHFEKKKLNNKSLERCCEQGYLLPVYEVWEYLKDVHALLTKENGEK